MGVCIYIGKDKNDEFQIDKHVFSNTTEKEQKSRV